MGMGNGEGDKHVVCNFLLHSYSFISTCNIIRVQSMIYFKFYWGQHTGHRFFRRRSINITRPTSRFPMVLHSRPKHNLKCPHPRNPLIAVPVKKKRLRKKQPEIPRILTETMYWTHLNLLFTQGKQFTQETTRRYAYINVPFIDGNSIICQKSTRLEWNSPPGTTLHCVMNEVVVLINFYVLSWT